MVSYHMQVDEDAFTSLGTGNRLSTLLIYVRMINIVGLHQCMGLHLGIWVYVCLHQCCLQHCGFASMYGGIWVYVSLHQCYV